MPPLNRIASLSASAPLMSVPDSRCPKGGVGEWLRGAGGLRLRLGFWEPETTPRGTVFVSPGRSEPVEKYYELIGDLLARDFCVVVHDWRGQGLSARLLPERLKCHARASEEFLDDYNRLLDSFEDRLPKPWLMIGHSMGAALNLATLFKGEPRIAGAVFCNPMLKLKTGKHALWMVRFRANWKVKHGQSTDYVPELFDDPFEHSFENDAITHDRRRYEAWREQLYACPHLGVGSPTWGWLNFAVKIGEVLMKDKQKAMRKIKVPLRFVCSGDDSVIQKQAVKLFVKRLPKGRYTEVIGADHELLIEETDMRDQFLAEFDDLAQEVAPVGGFPEEVTSHEFSSSTDEAPVDAPLADTEAQAATLDR